MAPWRSSMIRRTRNNQRRRHCSPPLRGSLAMKRNRNRRFSRRPVITAGCRLMKRKRSSWMRGRLRLITAQHTRIAICSVMNCDSMGVRSSLIQACMVMTVTASANTAARRARTTRSCLTGVSSRKCGALFGWRAALNCSASKSAAMSGRGIFAGLTSHIPVT